MLIHAAYYSALTNSYLNCNSAESLFIYEINNDFRKEKILTQKAKCNLTILSQKSMVKRKWQQGNRHVYIYIYII